MEIVWAATVNGDPQPDLNLRVRIAPHCPPEAMVRAVCVELETIARYDLAAPLAAVLGRND